MFEVLEYSADGRRRDVIAYAPSFIAAKNVVEGMGVLHMEDDIDYPGCADAYLVGSRVVAIQPVGFKVQSC